MEIRVLGPVDADDGAGGRTSLGGERARRLVAALASDPDRPIAAERLLDIVWPDGAPGGGTSTLQVMISRLRSVLGRAAIVSTPSGYALSRSGISVDADRFEALVAKARASDPVDAAAQYGAALDLWRGEAFGDLAGEWWARPGAERLEAIRLAARTERVDALLASGRSADAVIETGALVAAHPLHEGLVRQRMRSLHLDGRSAEALRAAASFRRRLADTSGLEPAPALSLLEKQILEHDPGLGTDPTSIRGYELGDLMAEGAHGAVYSAHQRSLGRAVAIKVLRRRRADDPDFVRRFEAEAQLVAQLEHPGIVPLYDFWREPGAAYLVFRLLRGGTLADRLVDGPPTTLADVDLLIERIGDALATSHRLGVVHRDVRPANILLDDIGHPYLTDFGIAAQVEEGADAASDDGRSYDAVGLAEAAEAMLARVGAAERTQAAPLIDLLRRFIRSGRPEVLDLVAGWQTTRIRAGERADHATAVHVRDGLDVDIENPFKGLRAFGEADRSRFFGRDRVVAAIRSRLDEVPLVCVVGPSGCGKSSIVHAGLAPELRERGQVVTSMTPGVRPMWALRGALRRVATTSQADAFADPADLLCALAGEVPLVVIIDQLEELWTVAIAEDRECFLRAIQDAIGRDGSLLRVVTTVRADFYDRPLGEPHLGALTGAGSFPVTPLDPIEVEQVIVEPLARCGVDLEPGLLAMILASWARGEAEPPQLQLMLAELYDRRVDRRLTIAAYRELGGISGVVATAAEDVLGQLSPEHQAEVRTAFEALVNVGESREQDTRRRVARGELTADDALELLGRARLVTFDRDAQTGEPTVEVAHESLLSDWPRLRGWIDDSRERLRSRRVTIESARAWAAAHRDPSHLLRGSRLESARAHDRDGLSTLEVEFLDACEDAEGAEQRRARSRLVRTQLLLATVAALLVVAVVAGAVVRAQRSDARRNAQVARSSEELAERSARQADAAAQAAVEERRAADIARVGFQARSIAPGDADLGLLLAAQVARFGPSTEASSALLSALVANPTIDRVIDLGLDPSDGVTAIAGRIPGPLLVATPTHAVVVDGVSLTPTGIGWMVDGPSSLAVSPDGREAVVVSRAGLVTRHDLSTGDVIGTPRLVAADIQVEQASPVAYLADGTLAVADGADLVLSPPQGTSADRSMPLGAPITLLEASPDDRRLLVVSTAAPGPAATFVLDTDTGARRPLGPTAIGAAIGPDDAVDVSTIGQVTRFDLRTGEVLAAGASATPVTVDLLALGDGRTLQMGIVRHLSISGPDLVAERIDTGGAPLVLGSALADGGAVVGSGHRLLVLDPNAVPMPLRRLEVDGVVVPRRYDDHLVVSGATGGVLLDATDLDPAGPLIPALGRRARGAISASDDATVVAGVVDGGVQVYDTRTGSLLGEVPTGVVGPAQLSPDGTMLAASTSTGVSIFAVPAMTLLHDVEISGTVPAYLEWSPNGDELWFVDLATRGHRIDPATGSSTPTGGGPAVYSGDGAFRLVIGADGEPIRIVDRATEHTVRDVDGFREIAAGLLLPDDRRLARAVAVEGIVDLVDLESGTRIGDPIRPLGTGELLFSPALAVSDDGATLLIGQPGVAVQRLELDPDVWLEMACAGAGRNLTHDEWDRYFGTVADYRRTCPEYPDGP